MNTLLQTIHQRLFSGSRAIYVLLYIEICELFARFGIGSLLVLYLTHRFHDSDAHAFVMYGSFMALIYLTPMLGGYLSDRLLGYRHAVLLGAAMMAIGNFCMVFQSYFMFCFGLSVVIIGSGFFLPSLTTLLGHLYEGKDEHREAGFTFYYLSKNIGALIAPVLGGFLAIHFGYRYAFLLNMLVVISGILVFNLAYSRVEQEIKSLPVINTQYNKVFLCLIYLGILISIPIMQAILFYGYANVILTLAVTGVSIFMGFLLKKRTSTERRNIGIILFSLIFVILFEGFLSQGGTTINLFIDRIVNRQVLGFTIPTTTFYALDPLFMMILGPFLAGFFLMLSHRGKKVQEGAKFVLSFAVFVMGFLILAFAAFQGSISGQASLLYIIFAYFLFPLAELLIIPVGLALVTRIAPKDLKAMMVGVFMLAQSLGSYLTAVVSKLGDIPFAIHGLQKLKLASTIYMHTFSIDAVILMGVGILAVLMAVMIRKKNTSDGID